MKDYEILEHTADVKFRAYGDSLEDAFRNSGIALFSIMTNIDDLEAENTLEFEIEEKELESLLFSFLEEIIFLRDYKEVLFKDLDVEIKEKNNSYLLRCVAETSELKEGILFTEVKAITYNEMSIQKKDSKFIIEAVLDL